MKIDSQALQTRTQVRESKPYKALQLLKLGNVVETTLGYRFYDTADLTRYYY